MKKIKLFTHNDLDGAGCAILAKIAYRDDIDIQYCGYNNINEKVLEFITNESNFETYSFVYITDISVNDDTAKKIDDINKRSIYQDGNSIFCLLDHHKTALRLNIYQWANVVVETNGKLESGTNLFYEYLKGIRLFNVHSNEKYNIQLVNQITLYDTWEWKKQNLPFPKKLNDIFGILGIDDFVLYHSERLTTDGILQNIISEEQEVLLKYKRIDIDNYINSKIYKSQTIKTIYGIASFVMCDRFDCTSELGAKLLENNEIDFAILHYDSGVSLRSKGEFDVSKIASNYSGGGHKNAAGFTLNKSYYIYNFIKSITNFDNI